MTAPQHTIPSLLEGYLSEVTARFWSRVDKSGDCWEWQAGRNLEGYGYVRVGNGSILAHRFSYESELGPIPAGLTIDHLCRNRGCVNPAHLEPVTAVVNMQRGVHGTYQRSKTHCPQGHPYSLENTYVTSSGFRQCRSCAKAREQVRTARHRLAKGKL